ncbi:MAG: hypothetical protein ACI8S6_003600 [Myxococcota bacterium]|jgi:hypothetical protein
MIGLFFVLSEALAGCPEAAVLSAEIVEMEDELAMLQLERDVLRAQRVSVEGEPILWADDAEAAVREEAFRSELDLLADELDVSAGVAVMDCTESPCIALLAGSVFLDEEGFFSSEAAQLMEAYVARHPNARPAGGGTIGETSDGEEVGSMLLLDFTAEPKQADMTRGAHRFGALMDDLRSSYQPPSPDLEILIH